MEEYDGIPVPDLPIDEIDPLRPARTEGVRRGAGVGDPASKSGRAIRVIGWSEGARRVLTVVLLPKEHPPTGGWWGVNAWAASSRDARLYRWEG